MMKKICSLLMTLLMVMPLISQEPLPAEESKAAEAAKAAKAAEAVETPQTPEAPGAPETPETPETPPGPGENAQVSEEDAVDQAIDQAISKPDHQWSGDTTNVMGKVEVIESPDKTRVTLGSNEVIIVEENGDSVIVGLGNKGISIVEDGDGVRINVLDMEERRSKHHKKKFNAHWAGLEVGLNNYLTPDFSMVLPADQYYMDLNTGKSWNWNINIFDFGVPLGTSYVGLVSGLGFEFINYNFNGQNSIMKDPINGETVEYIPPYAGYITKSKMNITYMTIPLLMEFQIPTDRGRIHISTGVIGGLKLWSNTKVKYTEAGDKSKEKNKSDFNLSPLRWGLTARVGYKWIGVYANYYMTSLFKPSMGPELNPFAVGLAFTW